MVHTPLFAASHNSEIQKALQMEENGDYEGAQAIYEKILKTDPTHEEALYGVAQVHYWQGDYDKALQSFQKLFETNPNHVPGLIGISKVYLAMGEQRKAQEYLNKAKELDPENEEIEVLEPQMGRKTRIRIDAGYTLNDLSYFADDTQLSFQEIEISKEKTYGFGLRTTYLRKFNLNGFDTQLFGHYWFKEKTRVNLGFGFTPKVNILPQESITAGVAHTIWKIIPELNYTFENYTQADQHTIAPALFFEPLEFFRIGGGYEHRRLLFGGNQRTLHSGFAKVSVAPLEWLQINGFYERLQSSFEGGRPGNAFVNYRAHVAGGGVALDFQANYAVHFNAYSEQRSNGEDIASYTLSFGYSF